MFIAWNIEQETGYKPISTFWEDFSIADEFGVDAIKDTYKRASEEWRTNYKMITELVLVLNHRSWLYYDLRKEDLSLLYEMLYNELDIWCMENLKKEELDYYLQVTD